MKARLSVIVLPAILLVTLLSSVARGENATEILEAIPAFAGAKAPVAKEGHNDLGSTQASRVEGGSVEYVGRIGGGQHAIDVSEGYAFIGEGTQLAIYDISNPSATTLLGKSLPLPGTVRQIAVQGDYVYVIAGSGWATYRYGLYVILAADPSRPTVVGSYEAPEGGLFYDIALTPGHAFLAAGSNGLHILDLSSPDNPTQVGFYDEKFVRLVTVVGDLAYLVGESWSDVLDVSDPANPIKAGLLNAPRNANDIAVFGNYAYVTEIYNGGWLHIIDIADLWSPQLKTAVSASNATKVVVQGDYAFTSGTVFDVSDPSWPQVVSNYPTYQRYFEDFQIEQGHLYGVNEGLVILDVNIPSTPLEISYLPVLDNVASIDVEGDVVYATDYEDALHSISVASKTSPYEVWAYSSPNVAGSLRDIAVDGGVAYYTTSNIVYASSARLHVLDVSGPDSPIAIANYDIGEATEEIVVSGDYAYVAGVDWCGWGSGSSILRILDVATPSDPKEVGNYGRADCFDDLEIFGNYAYLLGYKLWIVDISDVTSPTEVGHWESEVMRNVRDVAIADKYAFLAAGGDGVRVIDISNPAIPTEVGYWETEIFGSAYSVAVAGRFAFITDSELLRVVDATDPTQPVLVTSYDVPEYISEVIVSDGHIYLASNEDGLLILRFSGLPISPPLTCAEGEWVAEYFDNTSLAGEPVVRRCETDIDHYWGSGSPITGVPEDRFSVRWTQRVNFPNGGTYRFRGFTGDTISMELDGIPYLSGPTPGPFGEETILIENISSGDHDITVEFVEYVGEAMVDFTWYRCPNGAGDCISSIPLHYQTWDMYADIPMPENCTTKGNQSLAAYGCLVTSISMALSHYGVDTTPHELNEWLTKEGGYQNHPTSCSGILIWNDIIRFAKESKSGGVMLKWKSTDDAAETIRDGYPVIMRIPGNEPNETKHWLLATDVAELDGHETLGVNDPHHSYVCWTEVAGNTPPFSKISCSHTVPVRLKHATTQSEENAFNGSSYPHVYLEWQESAKVSIGASAVSPSLQLDANGAEILLIDENGAQVGYDGSTGGVLTDLPGSFYFDSEIVPYGSEPSGEIYRTLLIAENADNEYTLRISTPASRDAVGSQDIVIMAVGTDHDFKKTEDALNLSLNPGATVEVKLLFEPGVSISLTPSNPTDGSVYLPVSVGE